MALPRRFTIRLDEEIVERLEEAAKDHRRTPSALLRIIIEDWLDENNY